jgi:hypothetical protein
MPQFLPFFGSGSGRYSLPELVSPKKVSSEASELYSFALQEVRVAVSYYVG